MASNKSIQLLKMPDRCTENGFSQPRSQLNRTDRPSGSIKLLSFPQLLQEPDKKPIRLVRIPVSNTQDHNVSLLQLPRKWVERKEELDKPVLIDIRCIANRDASEKTALPLLQTPQKPHGVQMARIPLARNSENKEETPMLLMELRNDQHYLERKQNVTNVMHPSEIKVVSSGDLQNEEKQDKENLKQPKRKRRRKQKRSKENSGNVVPKNLEKFKTHKSSCTTSKEMQTINSSSKKSQKSRRKDNLMNLLEQAAFLFDSDVSQDDIGLSMLEGKSSLEPQTPSVVSKQPFHKMHNDPSGRRSHPMDSGDKQLSTEELLLRNLQDSNVDTMANLLDNSDLAQFLGKSTSKNETSQPQPLSVSSQAKPSFPESNPSRHEPIELNVTALNHIRQESDRPLYSAGVSWREAVSLSRNNTDNELKSKREHIVVKNAGVQTNDKKDQTSQTDFSFGKDVNQLILDHHEEQTKLQDNNAMSLFSKADSPKKKAGYPWEYIRKEDPPISDLAANVKSRYPSNTIGGQTPPVEGIASKQQPHNEGVKQTAVRNGAKSPQDEILSSGRDFEHQSDLEKNSEAPFLEQIAEMQPASGVNFAPDILLGMQIENQCIKAKDNQVDMSTKLLNVVDISKPSSDAIVGDVKDYHAVINTLPADQLSENVKLANNLVLEESQSFSGESKDVSERSLQDTTAEIHDDHVDDPVVERAEMSRRLEALLAKDPKNRLHSNLRNISVQLDALGDLHDNLEREMKQSALLMETVGTLHGGFFETDIPVKEKKLKSLSSMKRKSRKSQNYEEVETSDLPPITEDFAAHQSPSNIISSPVLIEDTMSEENKSDYRSTRESVKEFTGKRSGSSRNTPSFKGEGNDVERDEISGSLSVSEKISELESMTESEGSTDDDRDTNVGLLAEKDDRVGDDAIHLSGDDAIRLRVSQRYPTFSERQVEEDRERKEREIKEKLEKKRQALLGWMKKKRSEQHSKYQAEVGEKRQKEARPFVPLQNDAITKRTTGKQKENKKVLNEELYQDRINDANDLMRDIFTRHSEARRIEKSKRPFSVPADTKKRRKTDGSRLLPGNKTRGTNSAKTQRSQKNINDNQSRAAIRANEAKENNTLRKEADRKWLIDNLSPSWKFSSLGNDTKQWTDHDIGDSRENFSAMDSSLPLTSSMNKPALKENRFRLDFGELTNRDTSDLRSSRSVSRRSVEARDFVTRKSMGKYKKKTAKLLQKSLNEFSADSSGLDGAGLSNSFNCSFMTTLDMSGMGGRAKPSIQRTAPKDDSVQIESRGLNNRFESSSDAQDINAILTQYGLLDDDVNQRSSSETSQLLAEAKLILEDSTEGETSSVGMSGSVDWNQIDMILKQN